MKESSKVCGLPKRYLFLLFFLLLSATGYAQNARPLQWVTPEVRAPGVEFRTFESRLASARVSYHIYLPPQYQADETKKFPVVYWLHGTGGGEQGIPPLTGIFAESIRAGKIPPMLIVFVNGLPAGMWCDSKDGKAPVESILINELIPEIDKQFRTVSAPEGRILEGFSMGGYGAARIGMKHFEKFAAVSMLGAGPLDLDFRGPKTEANPALRERLLRVVYGGDIEYFRSLNPHAIATEKAAVLRGRLKLRILIGSKDFTLEGNQEFSSHLSKLGIAHSYIVFPEVGHNAAALIRAGGDSHWKFYRDVLSN